MSKSDFKIGDETLKINYTKTKKGWNATRGQSNNVNGKDILIDADGKTKEAAERNLKETEMFIRIANN